VGALAAGEFDDADCAPAMVANISAQAATAAACKAFWFALIIHLRAPPPLLDCAASLHYLDAIPPTLATVGAKNSRQPPQPASLLHATLTSRHETDQFRNQSTTSR
jgi:hypothetical protein